MVVPVFPLEAGFRGMGSSVGGHRAAELHRDLWAITMCCPGLDSHNQSRLLRAGDGWVLSISTEGGFSTSLGIILAGKRGLFPMFKQNSLVVLFVAVCGGGVLYLFSSAVKVTWTEHLA